MVSSALKPNRDSWGRRGVENRVARAFVADQERLGFHESHKIWGTHIYGKFGDRKYIKHLGIERKKYRKSNAIGPA